MWKASCLAWALASVAAAAGIPVSTSARASSTVAATTFELEITWEQYAPLNIDRKMLLVNGQTPGPELKFDEGDNVEVHVVNNSPFNTTVHLHGTSPFKQADESSPLTTTC